MKKVKQVIKQLGRIEILNNLDCGSSAISNALTRGSFPSSWYPTIQRLAEERGVEVPDHLFNWRCPEDVRSERTEGLSE